jgi:DNA-binding MurR/RpiR family transcriptional regulator
MILSSTSNDSATPRDLASLYRLVDARISQMSPQFHQVARYFVDNSDEVALAPVRVLAGHIGVHPSTIVRFAKYMNYGGFKEMQLVFKAEMYSRAQGVNSRISRLDQRLATRGKHKTDDGARNIIAAEITSLQTLLDDLSIGDLEQAVKLIAAARIIWIVCDLDGLAVGQHLTRMLTLLPRDARLLEGGSARAAEASRLIKAGDVVVAIELSPERVSERLPEVEAALKSRCKLIVVASDPRPYDGKYVTFHTSTNNTLPAPTLAGPMTLVHILGLQVANRTNPGRFRLPEVAQFDPLSW